MLADAAKSYLAAGLSVLPATRAKKRPSIRSWKQYQTRLPTAAEVGAWFANRHDALCLICGAVSGNFECLDFDSAGAAWEDFGRVLPPELGERLVFEQTPSGGYHVFYRCSEPVAGNQKLAMSEAGQVLIETRGEGGLVLVAPSEGYELLGGAFENLAVFTPAEREALLSAARALDRRPKPAAKPTASARPASSASPARGVEPRAESACEEYDLLPGEDYDARADIRPLLESYGWRYLRTTGENENWQRPGKTGDQQSATFNGTVFYVFSSNAVPFEAGHGYGKFAVYATLVHGGDLQAATEALYAEGYGHKGDPTAGVDSSAVIAQAQSVVTVFENAPAAAAAPSASPDGEAPPSPDSDAPSSPEDDAPPSPAESLWPLYSCPGFVDSLADYTLRTARYTNRALAFSGALALLSFLCGRRYRTLSHLSSQLYLIALADSATGKEWPRQVNFRLLQSFGYASSFGDRFASGEGLEDSLYRSPSMFYQPDEISFLFASFSDRNFSPTASSIANTILRLYTDGIYAMRVVSRKRASKGQAGEEAKARIIENPNLVLFGTATPEKFYSSLSLDGLENGLLGRCFVVPASARRVRNLDPSYDEQPPAVVRETFGVLNEMGDSSAKKDGSRSVSETPEATAELGRIDDGFTDRVNAALAGSQLDGGDAALWGRAFEKCYKLALLRAVSRDPEEPRVTVDDAQWGAALAEGVVLDLLSQARLHIASDDFMSTVNIVRRVLNSHRGKPVPRSVIVRATRVRTRVLDEVVDYLKEAGELEAGVARGARKTVPAYRLVKAK